MLFSHITTFIIYLYTGKYQFVKSDHIPIIRVHPKGKIRFGKGCELYGSDTSFIADRSSRVRILVGKRAECIIGNEVNLSSSTLFVSDDEKLKIGSYTHIAPGCVLMTTNFHALSDFIPGHEEKRLLKGQGSINIGDRVWLGLRVVVLPGRSIGENSIISAGSVVRKSINSGTIFVKP